MNGFFEDLEDGQEPVEADEGGWLERGPGWDGLNQLVTHEAAHGRVERPDLDTLIHWLVEDGGCEATDGCWVEPDGTCPHGKPSWFLVLGLV